MNASYAGLLILGFGGHARAVADVALATGIKQLLLVDANARPGETFLGHPVVAALPPSLENNWACFAASGDSAARATQLMEIRQRGWPVASMVAPTATIGAGAHLGEGCFVGHHAHVGPLTQLGEGVIVNTGAIVEHDGHVGAMTHLSVHCTLAGRVQVGAYCMVGAGAVVIDGLSIADHIILGAGSTAIRSLTQAGTYVGSPAQLSPSR